jgi:hypothetical protein
MKYLIMGEGIDVNTGEAAEFLEHRIIPSLEMILNGRRKGRLLVEALQD